MFFWNPLAFLLIQRMLAIWSLVPLPFLKPAWASIGETRKRWCDGGGGREGGGKVSLGSGTRATGHHWVFVSLSLCPGLRIIFLNHLLCFQVNHHPWLSRSCTPAQAVVKLPVRGASGRTAITAIVRTGGDWSTGLFSVCRDKRICMFFSLPLSSLLFSFLRHQWVEKLRQVEGQKLNGFRLVELIF